MKSRTLIIIIDILSCIPILAYPIMLSAGVMMFDSPGSGKSLSSWAIVSLSLLYPVFILGCIAYSWYSRSVLFPLLGLLPLLVMLYVLFVSGGTQYKSEFNTLPRDYVCDKNNFLSIKSVGGTEVSIHLLRRENPLSYQ